MARALVGRALVELGGAPEWRENTITDNGNILLDVHGLSITDPAGLESEINNIVGVVANGIFAAEAADVVFIAAASGVRQL
jgi:ribose 5-phosphate isomerase A